MKQILVCAFFALNLLEVELHSPLEIFEGPLKIFEAFTSVNYIIQKCRPEHEHKWSGKVTINETKITATSKKRPHSPSLGSRTVEAGPVVVPKTPKTSNGWISWLKNLPKVIISTIGNTLGLTFRDLCPIIPEPYVMPDLDLRGVTGFHAFNGSISGLRKLCERHVDVPISLTMRKLRTGVKYELELQGLHFHYHVRDKHLGINRTFNWTLSKGSVAEMSILVGFPFPCLVSLEEIDVRLDFDGRDGNRKCTGDCESVLSKLQCYLYYTARQAVGLLTEPLKEAIISTVCVSFKRMGLQEAD